MIQLEYNHHKISVPESWDEITLGTYESFFMERPSGTREQVLLIAKICQTDPELLLNWPAEVFSRILGYIDFVFQESKTPPSPEIEIDGVKYIVPIEEKLSLGAWVDVEDVQKKGERVLSNMLAIVCRPAGEEYNYELNEERAEKFARLPVSKVLGVLAFFLHCKSVSEQRTIAYMKLAEIADLLPRGITLFRNHGGGIRLSQISRILRYYILTGLLRYRLRKFSHFFNSAETKVTRKRHNAN